MIERQRGEVSLSHYEGRREGAKHAVDAHSSWGGQMAPYKTKGEVNGSALA